MWIPILVAIKIIFVECLIKKYEIKSLYGNHTIFAKNPTTIFDIKRILSNELNLPLSHINLHNEKGRLHNRHVLSHDDNKLNLSLGIRGGMSLTVKTLTGATLVVEDVNEDDTVLELKQKISKMQNMPIEHQRLIYNGRMLKNGSKLSDYKIKDKTVLHLVLRLRGGDPD